MLHMLAMSKYYFARLKLTKQNLVYLDSVASIPSFYFTYFLQWIRTSYAVLHELVLMNVEASCSPKSPR